MQLSTDSKDKKLEEYPDLDDISVSWQATVTVTSDANELEIEVPIPTKIWLVGFKHRDKEMELMFVNFLN